MSFLQAMYRKSTENNTNNKNPNRVSGGLRGQGTDHVVFMAEDGKDHEITTLKYTQALEDKLKTQYDRILKLEKSNEKLFHKISKMSNEGIV